ncbi:bifunctional ADP-dependent NAD(P)H-hydrate dehydratase/NAD(P)H-hydrate epimerase [Halomonas shantousis]
MPTSTLKPLYFSAQTREFDRRAIAGGLPGFALMQRAAMTAFGMLRERWPQAQRLSVVCGAGNNAGDGYVMATLAASAGLPVQLVAVKDPAELKGDAARAHAMARDAGLEAISWRDGMSLEGDVIVDALLGTGLSGEVREPFRGAIETINASGIPVLAVDVPSGLSADTGNVLGVAVKATLTATFIADKFGLHTGAAADHVGDLHLAPLGVEPRAHGDLAPAGELLDADLLARFLPPRPRTSHKGHNGHVLVIGGAPGFGGAALMACEAAARTGAGKISLATDAVHVTAALVRLPEVMVRGVRGAPDLAALLETGDVLVVGPGLGKDAWGQGLLQAALQSGKPLVVDADGLNLLARDYPCHNRSHDTGSNNSDSADTADASSGAGIRRDDWILTPHPGEAARLLNCSTRDIQHDRHSAVVELQRRYGGAILLKGTGSLIADADGVTVCPFGNPGMASGGMGDVLSGVLGALLAQGLGPGDAARVGAILHAMAADEAARDAGERGLLASDLACYVHKLANP